MRLNKLQLHQFRSYTDASWEFSPGINVLVGPNGVGKTNILEALYVGTLGKSHRTSETSDLLKIGSDAAGIIIQYTKKDVPHTLQLKLTTGRKEIKIDSDTVTQRELIGTLHTVLFCPEDLSLIKGSPSERRHFVDRELSQTSPAYYQHLLQYNKALQQRNRLLKQAMGRPVALTEWNTLLAEHGAFLIQKRLQSIKKINLLLDLMNRKLTTGKENLTVVYEQPYATDGYVTTKEELLQGLQDTEEKDRYRCSTSIGPHRDDLSFFSGQLHLKKYGSQGQQRTAILSLKLSELEFIKSEVGEYPVLLLDDVMSELDAERQQNLLRFIHKRIQTFITTTEPEMYEQLAEAQLIYCS